MRRDRRRPIDVDRRDRRDRDGGGVVVVVVDRPTDRSTSCRSSSFTTSRTGSGERVILFTKSRDRCRVRSCDFVVFSEIRTRSLDPPRPPSTSRARSRSRAIARFLWFCFTISYGFVSRFLWFFSRFLRFFFAIFPFCFTISTFLLHDFYVLFHDFYVFVTQFLRFVSRRAPSRVAPCSPAIARARRPAAASAVDSTFVVERTRVRAFVRASVRAKVVRDDVRTNDIDDRSRERVEATRRASIDERRARDSTRAFHSIRWCSNDRRRSGTITMRRC